MTGTVEAAWRFQDAKDHVQIDLPDLTAAVKASFTGDSVQIRSTHGSGEVLFEVPQLYSTIDAESSRLEVWGSFSILFFTGVQQKMGCSSRDPECKQCFFKQNCLTEADAHAHGHAQVHAPL